MKKFLFSVMAAALFVSCSQDDMTNVQYGNEADIKVSVADFEYDGAGADKPAANKARANDRHRVALNYDGSALKFSWQLGDQVGVFGKTDNQQVGLKMKNINSENELSAVFESNDFNLVGGNNYMAYYPAINNLYLDPNIPVDYTGQVQTSNNSTGHLGKKDYIFTPWTTATGLNSISFKFQHISAVLWLSIKMPDNMTAYKSVTLSAADKAFTTSAKIKLADVMMASDGDRQYISPNCITEKTMTNSVTLNFNGTVKADANNMLNAWMMVLPADFTSREMTVTVTPVAGDPLVCTIKPQKNFLSGKAYKLELTVESNESDEWVDLGLPSGTLWASKNVGAEKETDFGYYIGFGDPTGTNTSNNGGDYPLYDVNWTSYPVVNGLQCYVSDITYIGGYTNNYKNDMAHALMGGDWSLPKTTHVDELLSNTSYSEVTLNGVSGYKFTSKKNSNKYIFIPCAGYRLGTNVRNNGYMYFWTGELWKYPSGGTKYEINGVACTDWGSDSGVLDIDFFNRAYGFSVRAIKAGK